MNAPCGLEDCDCGHTIGKLREALMKYGNHHSSCILEHHAPGVRDCGCGYVAALREAIKEAKP